MERSEIINEIFDALYAMPRKESLDIANWGLENLQIKTEHPIYTSIVEEFLTNAWAVDQGLGFLILTYEGREMIDTFGSYNGFMESYMIPEKKKQKKIFGKKTLLMSSLILIPFIAFSLLGNTNDNKLTVDKKNKIESKLKNEITEITEIEKLKNRIEELQRTSKERNNEIVIVQRREIEKQKIMIQEQQSEIEDHINIIGTLKNLLKNQ